MGRGCLVAVAAAVVMLTAACSGGADDELPTADPNGADAGTGVDSEAEEVAYEECMRENGVDLSEEGLPDVDDDTLLLGMEACADQEPAGELELPTETVEELREWAECMRENGIDMPDPGADGSLDLKGIDVTGTDYAEADANC